MEAALFTLDIFFLVLLAYAVSLHDRDPKSGRGLGVFSFLEMKTDPVQKGVRGAKERPDA